MRKKSEAFTEALVGLFMTVVVLLLAYFTIVISGVDVLRGASKVNVTILFEQVGGLKDHDNVMYRGTKVGVVERVAVTPSNLVVTASIDRNVVMREKGRIAVCHLSMLGGNYLLFEEGEGAVLPLETTYFRGETPTDWMRDVAVIAANIRAITEMHEVKNAITNVEAITRTCREVSNKIDAFMNKANAVADRVERGEGTVGKLLSSDDALYNDFKAAVADAKVTMAGARASVSNVQEAVAHAKEIARRLDREQTYADLEAGVAAFRASAESFNGKETMAKANALLENLTAVSERLKNGDGTLGKLVNDPKMYDEVNALVKDVRQILDNYRDTTPITTFSSLATGAL